MKIFYSPTSPYSTKVRMAAHYAGLATESVLTDTNGNPQDLIASNPLGKIPTLVTSDGKAIYDSRVIMNFIDRETKGKLYPRNPGKRTDVELLEALCDGVCDCLLAIVYEKRFHPPEKVHQPWIDRQWGKGRPWPRPPQCQHAENRCQAACGPFRTGGTAALSRAALCRRMAKRPPEAEELAAEIRKVLSGLCAVQDLIPGSPGAAP